MNADFFQANWWNGEGSWIGSERMNVFQGRPHPGLLPREKGQRENIPGSTVDSLIESLAGRTNNRTSETRMNAGFYQANWQTAERSRIGFERMNVFQARPHPGLLPREKGQREDIPGSTVDSLIESLAGRTNNRTTEPRMNTDKYGWEIEEREKRAGGSWFIKNLCSLRSLLFKIIVRFSSLFAAKNPCSSVFIRG
ncbi:MAG TPA: hypothetical protein VGN23_14065 [Verrucomicrobiae bacterium]|jgi:hypothetical protein